MNVIYKYPVEPEFTLKLPQDAQVLSIQEQYGSPQMWVLLDPDAPKVTRRFESIPTGSRFDASCMTFIETFQVREDGLVFHLFEVKEQAQ